MLVIVDMQNQILDEENEAYQMAPLSSNESPSA